MWNVKKVLGNLNNRLRHWLNSYSGFFYTLFRLLFDSSLDLSINYTMGTEFSLRITLSVEHQPPPITNELTTMGLF